MTKVELLKGSAKGWFGNSQQHSIHAQLLKQRVRQHLNLIEEIGYENYLIEQLGE